MRSWVVALVWFAASLQAQPWALRDVSPKRTPRAISIFQVQIQELHYGREGPSYFAAGREPFAGTQELVEATLFGQEGISSVRFELIDESGQRLAVLPAFRIDDGADADQYFLQVEVPRQPFRFQIEGQDFRGQPFTNVYQRLFVPVGGSAGPVQLPAGLAAGRARQLQQLVDASARQTRLRFEAAAREHPHGLIRIARSGVLAASYEPLVSPLGNVLGIRLSLAVRFGQPGFYALTPYAFPLYANFQWRGAISMKVMDAQVSPIPPAVPGSPPNGIAELLRLGGKAHYDANVDYRLTFDLTPDYVIRNAEGSRYCLYTGGLRASGSLAAWEAIRQSAEPVTYRVDIASLDFVADTSALPPQRDYYDAFLREGARDCGPTPDPHF